MLGYCILPLNVALTACRLILIAKQSTLLFAVRFILVILGFVWSTIGKSEYCVRCKLERFSLDCRKGLVLVLVLVLLRPLVG